MFHIFCIFLLTFQFNVNVFCFLGLCLGCYFLSGLLNWRVTCSRPGEVSRSLYVSCCSFLDFWVSDKSCYYDSLYSYTKNYVVLVWSDTTELTKTPIDINVTIGTVINSHQGHMSDIIRPMFRTRRIHNYISVQHIHIFWKKWILSLFKIIFQITILIFRTSGDILYWKHSVQVLQGVWGSRHGRI